MEVVSRSLVNVGQSGYMISMLQSDCVERSDGLLNLRGRCLGSKLSKKWTCISRDSK